MGRYLCSGLSQAKLMKRHDELVPSKVAITTGNIILIKSLNNTFSNCTIIGETILRPPQEKFRKVLDCRPSKSSLIAISLKIAHNSC